jgi:hypothetical protein
MAAAYLLIAYTRLAFRPFFGSHPVYDRPGIFLMSSRNFSRVRCGK